MRNSKLHMNNLKQTVLKLVDTSLDVEDISKSRVK